MGNQLLTVTKITKEALRIIHNTCAFLKVVNRQYSKEYAVAGAKIGSTVNVRKPPRYYLSRGPALAVQNTVDTYVPLTLTQQYQVAINFTSAELTLSIEDFGKRILSPALARIASGIDGDLLGMYNQIYNQVGTPGTSPGVSGGTGMLTSTSPQVFLNAGAWLDYMATPRDENRRITVNPIAMSNSVAGLSGLYQDQEKIAEQYRKGVIGTALGFEFALDQNIQSLTTGTHAGYATAVVYGAQQTGAALVTNGWTANSAVLNQGEIIQVAGVYAVNPENQQSTGLLANFVVTANVVSDANGNATIPISPGIVVAGAGVSSGTVTASPAYGAAVSLMSGSASTTYPQNIASHQDAFTFATADLQVPGGVDFAAREVYDGISMRIIRDYDISSDQFPCRIDVLGGFAALRPEFAVRITG